MVGMAENKRRREQEGGEQGRGRSRRSAGDSAMESVNSDRWRVGVGGSAREKDKEGGREW